MIGVDDQGCFNENLVNVVQLLTDLEKEVLMHEINAQMRLGVHEGKLPFVNLRTALICVENVIAKNTEVEQIDVTTVGDSQRKFVEGVKTVNHPFAEVLQSIERKLKGYVIE